MLMPGFSSARVPVRIRLFLVIATTLALTPLLSPLIDQDLLDPSPLYLCRLLFWEILTGLLIGSLGRIFFGALETLAIAIAQSIGLAGVLGSPVQEGEAMPAIASLIVLVATILFFVMDLHWEVLRAIVASYAALPVSNQFDFQFGLIQISDILAKSLFLALRVSSPFIIFSFIVNFAIGLTSKMTPQIPVYFIMTPLVLGGGLFLLYGTCRQLLELFMFGFQAWLRMG